MENFSKEKEMVRKSNEMLEIKNLAIYMKNIFAGLSVDLTQSRKESVRLNIHQQNLPKLKQKEKKDWEKKIEHDTKELWDNTRKSNVYIIQNLRRRKKREWLEKIFKR